VKSDLARFALAGLALLLLFGSASAALHEEDVTYRAEDTELHGYLCYDDAIEGPRPAVLVVHEWWGLNDYARMRTEKLAALGYVALAVDLYGEGRTTEHPETAMEWSGAVNDELRVDRFQAAVDLLRENERVDGTRLAAIGYCFGGGTVLRLAAAGVDLKGVVSFHGSLPTEPIEPGTVKARVLVCHGAADPFTAPEQVQKFEEVFTAAGADWQMNVYGGAKHSFTVENAAEHGMDALAYDAYADHMSWAAMQAFLNEVFR
jgi:dienelactone hydrolase